MEHYLDFRLDNIVEEIDGALYIEEWKDIIGYEGLYQISDFGRVKSLRKLVGSGYYKNESILKQRIVHEYCICKLSKNDVDKHLKVHRLVGIHFLENPDNKPQINHKKGVKTDNRKVKIEWSTHSENTIHSFLELNRPSPKWGSGRSGSLNGRSKKTIQFDMNGSKIKEWESCNMAAAKMGVHEAGIRACCVGRTKTAYGYKWSYKTNVHD